MVLLLWGFCRPQPILMILSHMTPVAWPCPFIVYQSWHLFCFSGRVTRGGGAASSHFECGVFCFNVCEGYRVKAAPVEVPSLPDQRPKTPKARSPESALPKYKDVEGLQTAVVSSHNTGSQMQGSVIPAVWSGERSLKDLM